MVKDWVLEQKKGFWSMIKEWKDLEHDLGLIEDKNMKILCKNIRHGRDWYSPDRASKLFPNAKLQRDWHGPCLQEHGRTQFQLPFFVVLFTDWHGPC